jgi:hypothetical protein
MTARPPQKVRQIRNENLLDLRDVTLRDVKHQMAESRVRHDFSAWSEHKSGAPHGHIKATKRRLIHTNSYKTTNLQQGISGYKRRIQKKEMKKEIKK